MGGGAICNLGNPTLAGYAVTKGYVDDQTKNLLRLDGARAMTENLNMGARDHAILGVRSSSADNSVITVGGAKATYLPLNGENVTQGDLKMNNHDINKIKNLEVNGNSKVGGTLIVSGESSFNSAMNISGNLDLVDYKVIRLGDGTKKHRCC